MEKLNYGNWIRRKMLWLLGLTAFVFIALAGLSLPVAIRIVSGILGLAAFISFLFPLYSYLRFSPRGGNLQEKLYDRILDHLQNHAMGDVLDIGTGNGILAIKAALRNQAARVIGVDFWGKEWEYSKTVCEKNAGIAKVQERVHFQKGDAASLNFPDATFDAVVSSLTFHEVKLVKRKADVLREALRVLKPGGSFVFVDYFYEPRYYGDTPEFEILLWSLKLAKVDLKPLDAILVYPKALRHPRALGRVGVVYGIK